MIREILEPLVCERFLTDARYREGHLRILNALPGRVVLGLHSPDMKEVAKALARERGEELIMEFEKADASSLCYEEIVVWGFMINFVKCPAARRFEMLDRYVPVMDNWGVCDSYAAHAKWMKKVPADELLAYLDRWFGSFREFEVRFAVVVSMCYLIGSCHEEIFKRLDAIDFDSIKSEYVSVRKRPDISGRSGLGTVPEVQGQSVQSVAGSASDIPTGFVLGPEPYYVRMAVAWFLATALAKHPEAARAYARRSSLPPDVLKLYARKARESFRTRTVSPF